MPQLIRPKNSKTIIGGCPAQGHPGFEGHELEFLALLLPSLGSFQPQLFLPLSQLFVT